MHVCSKHMCNGRNAVMSLMRFARPWLPVCLAASLLAPVLLTSPARAGDLKVWRHGVVQAKGDAGFVFMASKGGFANKQGLDLKMVQFKGDAHALRALIAGDIDSYEGSAGGPMLAAARGADVKIVGCYWPTLTYEIYSKASIKTPAELRGKTLAISAPGALPDLVERAVLEKYNIPLDQVRFTSMGGDADRFKAVSAGVVDAAAASLEFAPLAKKNGVRWLLDARTAVPNYVKRCTIVSRRSLDKRRTALVAYLAAQMNALRYALSHRDKTIALSHEITHIKPSDPRPAFIYDEVKRISAIDPTMQVPSPEKLTWMRGLLLKTGNLKTSVDVEKLVDGGPRKIALKLVNK